MLVGCSAVVQCQFDSELGREMPSMAASHGGILYYVVKVPKETRLVTPGSIGRDILIFEHVQVGWV